MSQLTEETWVADIVKEVPKTGDLFRKLRIDFCCGGKISLREAAANRGLHAGELLTQIHEVEEKQAQHKQMQPPSLEPKELIAYIQNEYHTKLREELSALTPYVTKLTRVHGERYPHLKRVNELFTLLKQELSEHIQNEEDLVFPMIEAFLQESTVERADALNPILSKLQDEHQTVVEFLKEMRLITNGFEPMQEACGTHRLVLKRLEDLEADVFNHILLENCTLVERTRQAQLIAKPIN
ncbi:iron-sulfur cluster repair di-iron protein [Paenibacillus terrae]|uniref:Iron-sulfur cluster repair di-iron protein n=1 Tax=Paenibacillus terrae TaxID=159743 RepID=A0A0D7X118_9BACL|nr:iron-sulfur cluster repair di-iron protein [Paenibacillus terrae]KJD43697.1 iron-sulfur cluster repair di-iron protein [Paenibacillus terrae]